MTAQKFALFKGLSRGGKGTLCRIIMALVGEGNYAGLTLKEFGDKHGLELILGSALPSSATPRTRPWERSSRSLRTGSSRIVGNDPVPVNRKNRDMMTMAPPCKFIMICNVMPPLGNRKNALTNR